MWRRKPLKKIDNMAAVAKNLIELMCLYIKENAFSW